MEARHDAELIDEVPVGGHGYGADFYEITREQLTLLGQGKVLCFDSQGEYTVFVKSGPSPATKLHVTNRTGIGMTQPRSDVEIVGEVVLIEEAMRDYVEVAVDDKWMLCNALLRFRGKRVRIAINELASPKFCTDGNTGIGDRCKVCDCIHPAGQVGCRCNEELRIDDPGRCYGPGTTSPVALLHVMPSAESRPVYLDEAGTCDFMGVPTHKLRIVEDGNVGAGGTGLGGAYTDYELRRMEQLRREHPGGVDHSPLGMKINSAGSGAMGVTQPAVILEVVHPSKLDIDPVTGSVGIGS